MLAQLKLSNILVSGNRQFSIGTNPRFHVLQQGSNLHPVINSEIGDLLYVSKGFARFCILKEERLLF